MTAVIHVAFCLSFPPGNIFSVKANPTYKEVHDTMKREWPNDKDAAAEKVYLHCWTRRLHPVSPVTLFNPPEWRYNFSLVTLLKFHRE